MTRLVVRGMIVGALGVALVGWLGCSSDPSGGGGGGAGGGAGGNGGAGGIVAEPYSIQAFDQERISSDSNQPNFHNIYAAIDFRDGPFSNVTLVIDLDTTCYPFESWQDNPPPPGENWPADCDAFDRNFEWSLDDPENDGDPPGLELVRAITPFGGPMHLELDITDVANGLPGAHQLKAHITTWSDGAGQVSGSNGGWTVSARLDVTPGPAPRQVLAVVPLYYGSQDNSSAPGPLAIEVPEGAVSGKVEYRVTGHGGGQGGNGCIGPAEEFCNRDHTIRVDGADFTVLSPWRTDCSDLCTIAHYGPASGGFDYCLENPCGAISSVNAPRANWCPGDVSAPFVLEPPELAAPGAHSFEWSINTIADGGSWKISATYFAYGD